MWCRVILIGYRHAMCQAMQVSIQCVDCLLTAHHPSAVDTLADQKSETSTHFDEMMQTNHKRSAMGEPDILTSEVDIEVKLADLGNATFAVRNFLIHAEERNALPAGASLY